MQKSEKKYRCVKVLHRSTGAVLRITGSFATSHC